MNNPVLEAADLRGEYQSQWIDFARTQAKLLRLKAEIDGKSTADFKATSSTPVPQHFLSEIIGVEADQLKVSMSDFEKDKAFFQQALELAQNQINTLTQQQRQQEKSLQDQYVDVSRIRALQERGIAPVNRVTEEQRSASLTAERLLQTTVEVVRAMRGRDEAIRQLQRVADQRRSGLLKEIEDTQVRLSTIQSRLQALGEKLSYVGGVRSQLIRGEGAKPNIAIIRKTNGGRSRITGSEDTEVLPGDVISVALQPGIQPAVGSQ